MRLSISLHFLSTALMIAEQRSHVDGRLMTESAVDGLTVEVTTGNGVMASDTAAIQNDGSFRVAIPRGERTLRFRVLNRQGHVLQETSMMPMAGTPVELRLTPQPRAVGAASTAGVSLQRLQFRPSAEDRRLFERSEKLLREGKYGESLAAMEELTVKQPKWFDAWTALARRQGALGRYQEALASFQNAIRLDGNVAELFATAGLTLVRLRRYAEAKDYAHRALRIDPDLRKAGYVMGLSMAGTGDRLDRAVMLLVEAEPHFPEAGLALAVTLYNMRRYEESLEAAWRHLHTARTPRMEVAGPLLRDCAVQIRSSARRIE